MNDLRRQYDLPVMEGLNLAADANVNLLSLMQLRRVNLKSISDEQFKPLLRRVLLSRHHLHAYETLREYIENRGHLAEEMPQEREQALEALVDICRRTLRRDEAIKWVHHGQSMAKTSAKPFNSLVAWKMKELVVRLEDKQDPELKKLYDDMWLNLAPKLPAIRDALTQLGATAGLEPPEPEWSLRRRPWEPPARVSRSNRPAPRSRPRSCGFPARTDQESLPQNAEPSGREQRPKGFFIQARPPTGVASS